MHEPTVVRVIAFPNAMLLPLVTFLLFLLAAAGPPRTRRQPLLRLWETYRKWALRKHLSLSDKRRPNRPPTGSRKADMTESAAIDAAGGAGFGHHDLRQLRQPGLEARPDPGSEVLAGRVFQALDLVEVVVVKLAVDGLEARLELGEVHHPAELGIDLAGNVDFHAEGMAMQPGALVARRHVR